MRPNLLITGASGTLGAPLSQCADQAGWAVTGTYLTHPDRMRAGTAVALDLRDSAAVADLVRELQPPVIIHAAVTERSGDGYAEAIRLSGRHIAQAAVETGARLIALSTDLVFDGTKLVYTEDDPPQPLAGLVYGQAKADAERDIRAICPDAVIVRTSLIYDFDPLNAQVAWMLRTVERGEPVKLYQDQIRCPIWAINLADALLELAHNDYTGDLHVVGPAAITRYHFGSVLLEAMGIQTDIIPIPAPDSPPKHLNLCVDRARAVLHTPLLTIEEAKGTF
jgi:dTDP-4-dehydrorhamnose reductase